jgi:endonuclease G
MALTRFHPDNGDSQLLLVIGDGVGQVGAGTWRLKVVGAAVPEADAIEAWIERGDEFASAFLTHVNEEMTLSIPGTAANVIAVAAVDAAEPIVVGDFSSYGPTRDGRRKPEVAAPGVGVLAANGGTTDGAVAMDGTSMAAPHVAGAVALVLSKAVKAGRPAPTQTQITAVMRQKTLNYNGQFDRGQGFGVIDVTALLAGS